MKRYDLIVVGGGLSGTCAAIAAARGGVKVLLVDKSNCLGGAAMNCLVTPFTRVSCMIDGEKVFIAAGIFGEIREKLMEREALDKPFFKDEELKQVLNDMAREAGVDLLFHAYLTEAEREADRIVSATFSTVAGKITLSADYFIDATGDAQLSFLAGIPTKLGRESDSLCQPMTLCFRVGGVDVDAFFAHKEELNLLYQKKQAEGEIKNPRENILSFRTLLPGVVHFNTTRVAMKNPTDPWEVTEAELIARDQMFEVFNFMKQNAKGMENAFLLSSAMEIGIRESRMIVGDYVLTEEDCKNCTKFDDGITACNYDIDIHNPEGTGTSHHYFGPGEYYTIPYRSLIPLGVENVLVAGRCLSSDHGAQASYRVMPVVSCIGQAAGEAMALAVRDKIGVRKISVDELQRSLKAHNAFVDKLRGE